MVVFGSLQGRKRLFNMIYDEALKRRGEDEEEVVSEDSVSEVLDEDEDKEEDPLGTEEEEKAWE
ncbi:MAG: hypothetical protein Q8R25_04285 [bacterium]|nr:hypothetical protein [bacterium]